jgi:hypothetical protein
MSNEKYLLNEVAEGQIDDIKLYQFLDGYGFYWHYCHAKGRVDTETLQKAERNAIAFAKRKCQILVFGEMTFTLTTVCEL